MADTAAKKFVELLKTKGASDLCRIDGGRVLELRKRWGCGKGADRAFLMALGPFFDGVHAMKAKLGVGTMVYCFRCDKCDHLQEPPREHVGRVKRTEGDLLRQINTLEHRIRRLTETNERLKEENKELREQKTTMNGFISFKDDLGHYKPCIVMASILLRSHGVGTSNTSSLICALVRLFCGVTMDPIARSTIQEWDWLAGPLSTVLFMGALVASGVQGTSVSQDTSAGARNKHGYKVSALSINAPHPSKPDRVIQAVAHSTVGERGTSAAKGHQLDDLREFAEGEGLPVKFWVFVGDHASDAMGAPAQMEDPLPFSGCGTHKLSNTVESGERVLASMYPSTNGAKDQLADHLKTLSTSQDASKTASTTSSGTLSRSRSIVENSGKWPKDQICQREIGVRFGWRSILSAKALEKAAEYASARDRGDLLVQGEAVDKILDWEATRRDMAAGTLLYGFMLETFSLLKSKGTLNVLEGRKQYPKIRQLLLDLKQGAFPSWLSVKLPGLTAARKIKNNSPHTFKKIMESVVDTALGQWDDFVSKDESLEAIPLVYQLSVPISNDFLEGYNGTLSFLFSCFTQQANPSKVAGLAAFLHNKGSLDEFGVKWDEVDATHLAKAASYSKRFRESVKDIQSRVHHNTKVPQIERKLKDTPALDVKAQAKENGIQYSTKAKIVPILAECLYAKESPSPKRLREEVSTPRKKKATLAQCP